MLVGFSLSGKSNLAKKIQENSPGKFTKIDSNSIHDFLNKTYSVFQDDNTIYGKSFELRQRTTKAIHNALLSTLFQEGYSVILDSCNLARERRDKIITKIKKINKNIATIVLYNQIPEEQLHKNLRKADQRNLERGKKPVWVDLYEKVQKPRLEEPQEDEADHFFTCTRGNLKGVFDNLKKIVGNSKTA
jgi:predicted kinase